MLVIRYIMQIKFLIPNNWHFSYLKWNHMVYTNWVNFSMNHNNLWAIIEEHVHSLWVIWLSAFHQINNICILNLSIIILLWHCHLEQFISYICYTHLSHISLPKIQFQIEVNEQNHSNLSMYFLKQASDLSRNIFNHAQFKRSMLYLLGDIYSLQSRWIISNTLMSWIRRTNFPSDILLNSFPYMWMN